MRRAYYLRGAALNATNRIVRPAPDTVNKQRGYAGFLFVSGDADGTRAAGNVGSFCGAVYVCFVEYLHTDLVAIGVRVTDVVFVRCCFERCGCCASILLTLVQKVTVISVC